MLSGMSWKANWSIEKSQKASEAGECLLDFLESGLLLALAEGREPSTNRTEISLGRVTLIATVVT